MSSSTSALAPLPSQRRNGRGLDQQTLLPAETCIEALVQAGGNTALAAERLFGPPDHCPNAIAYLTASIAQDPTAQDSLNAQLRTLTTLQAFDTLNAAKALIDANLIDLEPADFVKFYTALVQQVAALTAISKAYTP